MFGSNGSYGSHSFVQRFVHTIVTKLDAPSLIEVCNKPLCIATCGSLNVTIHLRHAPVCSGLRLCPFAVITFNSHVDTNAVRCYLYPDWVFQKIWSNIFTFGCVSMTCEVYGIPLVIYKKKLHLSYLLYGIQGKTYTETYLLSEIPLSHTWVTALKWISEITSYKLITSGSWPD